MSEYKLEDIVRGDTLRAQTFTCSFKNAQGEVSAPPGVVTSARLQFRAPGTDSENGAVIQSFTTDTTLGFELDGNDWKFTTPPVVFSTSFVGIAEYDLEVTYIESGTGETIVMTFFTGGTLNVVRDVTR
jgi:hypothetical protein